MHRTAGEADSIIERLFLSMQAGEGRQQGRVDVQDGIGECRDHHIGQYSHETGQYNQINPIVPEYFHQSCIVLTTIGKTEVLMDYNRDVVSGGTSKCKCLGTVADNT